MWYNHLKQVTLKKTEISELDTILGKKEEEEFDEDSLGNFFKSMNPYLNY
jgi:hypothetical protein